MLPQLEKLVQSVECSPEHGENPDILSLGLLFELSRQARPLTNQATVNLLPSDLRLIEICVDDQENVIERITTLIRRASNSVRRSLFWILSKTEPGIAFGPVVKTVCDTFQTFDPEVAYQAFMAIDSYLFYDHDGMLLARNASLVGHDNFVSFLNAVETKTDVQRFNSMRTTIDKLRSVVRS